MRAARELSPIGTDGHASAPPSASSLPPATQLAVRRAGNRKIGFYAHLIAWGTTLVFLTFVAGIQVGLIVALSWGIGLSIHGFFAIVAPMLRERWTNEEIDRRVTATLTTERTAVAGKHARSLEVLSASIAHEIRNPITAARSLVAQMGEDPAAPENAEYARVALEELDRVERSITYLLRYARDEAPRFQDVALVEIVDSAIVTLRDRVEKSGAIVTRSIEPEVMVRADPEQLRRVVINLMTNALEALDAAGIAPGCIELEGGENLAGTEVWLRVRDDGPGIPADRLQRLFEPFHTTKATGTGLGLPIARKIVELHGGTIDVRSSPGSTQIEMICPRTARR